MVVLCGPLLNYTRMALNSDAGTWLGSVLIVTQPGTQQPRLTLRQSGPVHYAQVGNGAVSQHDDVLITGTKLYEDLDKAFWRFSLVVPLESYEACG